MANFTQTLSSTINFLGPQRSTKWGSPMTWGSDAWGFVTHTTGNFYFPMTVGSFHNDTGPTFLDSTSYVNFRSVESAGSILASSSTGAEYLRSGNYYYVLPGGVTNDEYAVIASWSRPSSNSNTWSLKTTSSVSWVTSPSV